MKSCLIFFEQLQPELWIMASCTCTCNPHEYAAQCLGEWINFFLDWIRQWEILCRSEFNWQCDWLIDGSWQHWSHIRWNETRVTLFGFTTSIYMRCSCRSHCSFSSCYPVQSCWAYLSLDFSCWISKGYTSLQMIKGQSQITELSAAAGHGGTTTTAAAAAPWTRLLLDWQQLTCVSKSSFSVCLYQLHSVALGWKHAHHMLFSWPIWTRCWLSLSLCSSVVQVWWMCTSRPWQLFDFFFNFVNHDYISKTIC